jgi:cation:H+ antiporter
MGRRRQARGAVMLSHTMSLPVSVLLVVMGMALLAAGGEALVRGAVSLARLLRVGTVVIGLTIVAMGTSAPELAASLTAALQGRGDIAIGNVVGSNIFNIAAIIAVCAMVLPVSVHLSALRLEWPVMLVVSIATVALALDGLIGRVEGAALVVTLTLFTAYLVRNARATTAQDEAALIGSEVDALTVRPRHHQATIDTGLVLVGLVLLVTGAQVLVKGAVAMADLAGLSERVIGLTIVAAGTSMPELATGIVAARRGQAEIALANVIGSNIFNLTGIIGTVAIVTPQAVSPAVINSDFWWMVAYAVILFPLMRSGMRITRAEGAALLVSYGVYLAMLLR